jgi:hypothetical protein
MIVRLQKFFFIFVVFLVLKRKKGEELEKGYSDLL